MKVNEIIKKRRKELGLTLKDVAQELGVSESLISRYESNDVKNMGIDKLTPLAKVLNCSPAYLMGWTDFTSTLNEEIQTLNEGRYIPEKKVNERLAELNSIPLNELTKEHKELISIYQKLKKTFETEYDEEFKIAARDYKELPEDKKQLFNAMMKSFIKTLKEQK